MAPPPQDVNTADRKAGRGSSFAVEPIARLLCKRSAAIFALIAGAIYLVEYTSWMNHWRGAPVWSDWLDQGRYIASAGAFAALDFTPSRHFYPPLYALLAAPFARLGFSQPFFLVDLSVLMACVAIVVRLFGSLLGSELLTGALALIFLLWPGVLFETFIIPWTSTLATLLVLLAILLLMKLERSRHATIGQSFLFGLVLGLIVPTRPLDALAALASLPFWLVALSSAETIRGCPHALRGSLPHLIAVALGAGIGPLVYLGSNLLIHGQLSSPYIPFSLAFFARSTIPEKFVSIFFDSSGLYLAPAQTLAARFPFIILVLPALAVCLRYGPLWLRAAALMTMFQFTFYMAYLDLLPQALYRYLNYHYFRWALWLGFMMLPAACVLLYRRFGARAWAPGVALIAGGLVVGSLQFRISGSQGEVSQTADRVIVHLEPERAVDYVDVTGLVGSWQKTYSPSAASIDGRAVPFWFELRTLPAPAATRFLFLHPVRGERLEIAKSGWAIDPEPHARTGRYGFTLGFPAWLRRGPREIRPGAPVALDGPLAGNIFAEGFADFDGRGRRMRARDALLRLPLRPRITPYLLRLKVIAVDQTGLDIAVDDDRASARTIEPGPQEQELELRIFTEAFAIWRPLIVRLTARLPLRDGEQPAGGPSITGLRVE
jgi:hypothetical protein